MSGKSLTYTGDRHEAPQSKLGAEKNPEATTPSAGSASSEDALQPSRLEAIAVYGRHVSQTTL